MPMRNYFIYDGENSKNYGLYINGLELYGSPARSIEAVEVPGRNGSVLFDRKSYPDKPMTLKDCFIYDNFKRNLAGVRNWLGLKFGYKRMETSYFPDEFYLAYMPEGIEPAMMENLRAGTFDIQLMRRAERFLKSGELPIEITNGAVLHNPGGPAKPLIYTEGNGTLHVGPTDLTITGAVDYTYIDCEAQDCYRLKTENKNNLMSGEYPTIQAGDTEITFSGFTKVEITPRWWIL